MPLNEEFLTALPISSTSATRNHEFGNTDTAKSDLSVSVLFGSVEYFTATGGVTFGGTAATSYQAASFAVFEYSSTGGVTLGGAAAISRAFATVASGGTVFGGSAAVSLTKTVLGSGGLALTGTATFARTKAVLASGGYSLSGSSAVARTFAKVGSGGFALAGATSVATTKAYSFTGSLALGGTATTELQANNAVIYEYMASGGVVLSGAAATQPVHVFQPSIGGGLALAGAAAVAITKAFAPSGGLLLGGDFNPVFIDVGLPPRGIVTVYSRPVANVQQRAVGCTIADSYRLIGQVQLTAGPKANLTLQPSPHGQINSRSV